jgi:hypothetical protein
VRSNADVLSLLPRAQATRFFLNIAALRQAGMLSVLAGVKASQDREYAEFVRQTQFDYTRDMQTLAGEADPQEVLFVIRGRFDWPRLRQYAEAHGGTCADALCRVATSNPGRWASFRAIQPDVLALALSNNSLAALTLSPRAGAPSDLVLTQPVWLKVSREILRNPSSLPVPLRIFAISLQPADPVILSLAPAQEPGNAAFDLHLDAYCPSVATAETVRNQLEIQTRMLKLELARERQHPNPADLTGLLTAGTFEVVNRRVAARWPVSKELFKALE